MTRRVQRVAKLLKQQLATLMKETLSEEIGLVTVTSVDVSVDIKNAKVFICCFDKTCEKEVLKKLAAKTQDFQHILGRRLQMRYTPKLVFEIDRSLEKISRVEEILEDLNEK